MLNIWRVPVESPEPRISASRTLADTYHEAEKFAGLCYHRLYHHHRAFDLLVFLKKRGVEGVRTQLFPLKKSSLTEMHVTKEHISPALSPLGCRGSL